MTFSQPRPWPMPNKWNPMSSRPPGSAAENDSPWVRANAPSASRRFCLLDHCQYPTAAMPTSTTRKTSTPTGPVCPHGRPRARLPGQGVGGDAAVGVHVHVVVHVHGQVAQEVLVRWGGRGVDLLARPPAPKRAGAVGRDREPAAADQAGL